MNKSIFLKLLIIFCLLIICTCSKSTNSNQQSDDDYELLISADIGSEGGTLGSENLTVTIPSGAFATEYNLRVYESDTKNPFGADQFSSTYMIEGLPENYSQTISIRIKYDGDLSGTAMIAIGEENTLCITDTTTMLYTLMETEETGGYLEAELPSISSSYVPMKTSLGNTETKKKREIIAVQNYDTPLTSSGGYFKVYFPSDVRSTVETYFLSDLEKALDTAQHMGFDINFMAYPVNVYISPVVDYDENRCASFLPVYGNYCLYVDKNKFSQPFNFYDNISVASGREILHMIFSVYDPYYFTGTDSHLNLEHYWFHTAVSVWAGIKFTTDINMIPVEFWGSDYLFKGDRGKAPFNGVQAGATSDRYTTYKHGCGMAGMIKYLVDRYGNSIIFNTYNHMFNNGSHPITALRSAISDPITEWYPDFLRTYLAGNIYKYDPLGHGGEYGDGLNILTDRLFEIKDKNDENHDFVAFPPDLSASDFYVALDYTEIDSSAMIKFTLTSVDDNYDNLLLMAYGYARNPSGYEMNLLPFEEATQELLITNIRDLIDGTECKYIVPIVVNSNFNQTNYRGDKAVILQTEVIKPNLTYDECTFMVSYQGHIRTQDDHSNEVFITDMGNGWSAINGYFEGNTFIGELDENLHYSEEGTVEVTIDPETYSVIGFKINTSRNDAGLVESWSVENSGPVNIPATWTSPFNDGQENEVKGTDACTNLNIEMFWQFAGTTQTMEAISCNSYSEIKIVFEDSRSDPGP